MKITLDNGNILVPRTVKTQTPTLRMFQMPHCSRRFNAHRTFRRACLQFGDLRRPPRTAQQSVQRSRENHSAISTPQSIPCRSVLTVYVVSDAVGNAQVKNVASRPNYTEFT